LSFVEIVSLGTPSASAACKTVIFGRFLNGSAPARPATRMFAHFAECEGIRQAVL
jgi:hypothetical protein